MYSLDGGCSFELVRDAPAQLATCALGLQALADQHPMPALVRPHRPGAATHLSNHLRPVEAVDLLGRTHQTRETDALSAASADRPWFPRLAAAVGSVLQPQGDTHNDNDPTQRVLNVLTSLPFLAVGANELRKRRTPEGRTHAMSLLAVGTVATAYHASSGESRLLWRKLDYWTIGVSSALMGKALWPEQPLARHALTASLLAIPFQPLVVSTLNILVMQAEFMRQAKHHKSVRRDLKLHLAAAAAGALAFASEDPLAERGFPHMHSCWHLLAAGGVTSMCGLINHKERLRVQEQVDAIKPLRDCHDSARSLRSMGRTDSWKSFE